MCLVNTAIVISDQTTWFVGTSFAYHYYNSLGKMLNWVNLFPVSKMRIIVTPTVRADVRITR